MADIYSGAWIVLAATRASDCAEGFLQSRQTLMSMHLPDTAVAVSARRVTTHDYGFERSIWKNSVDDQPLYQRAWAMLEREMAHRFIHFLPDEVLWRCTTTICCECGLLSFDHSTRLSALPGFSQLLRNGYGPHSGPEFGIAWSTVIMEYCSLKMTRLSDILPALAGLTYHVTHLTPGRYIAGL
jgi:hypothetical protein